MMKRVSPLKFYREFPENREGYFVFCGFGTILEAVAPEVWGC